jgi:hypothetical protein
MTRTQAGLSTPILPNPLQPAGAIIKQFKERPLFEQLSILVAAISAGSMTGLIFIVCADGFIATLGQSLGLPMWVILTLVFPVTLIGIIIGGWMIRSTFRYECGVDGGRVEDASLYDH